MKTKHAAAEKLTSRSTSGAELWISCE